MKEVRNNQLRKMLNKEGIKDVVLNFSEGTCRVYSDDEETNYILTGGFYECEYCMHFCQHSVQTWAEWIREVWKQCKEEQAQSKREHYELMLKDALEFIENGWSDKGNHIL